MGTAEFSYSWRNINIQGDFVILNNENSCRVYSLSGKERFAGEFDFSVAQVTRGRAFNSLIISGGRPDAQRSASNNTRLVFKIKIHSRRLLMNQIDTLSVNAIRILSADAIQKANSGHPGLPLVCSSGL